MANFKQNNTLILASSSPRRQALFAMARAIGCNG
jgi:predicted house-cleaning NTP pyrophosphatase (Maf/HAM1 superfamily)